jgi:hypothetical protein
VAISIPSRPSEGPIRAAECFQAIKKIAVLGAGNGSWLRHDLTLRGYEVRLFPARAPLPIQTRWDRLVEDGGEKLRRHSSLAASTPVLMGGSHYHRGAGGRREYLAKPGAPSASSNIGTRTYQRLLHFANMLQWAVSKIKL